jgi:hypothetical protein
MILPGETEAGNAGRTLAPPNPIPLSRRPSADVYDLTGCLPALPSHFLDGGLRVLLTRSWQIALLEHGQLRSNARTVCPVSCSNQNILKNVL